ncbi:VanZ family protein [Ureibacillus composti]
MKKLIKGIFDISFIFYLFVLLIILFLGTRGYRGFTSADFTLLEYIKTSSNFVPFNTISTYFKAIFDGSMNMDIPIKNLAGNFILFLPMGLYLPFLVRKINKVIVFSISMIFLLFFIEVTQVVIRKGSFDIDDFILNMLGMLGTLIGFGIWKMEVVQKLLK